MFFKSNFQRIIFRKKFTEEEEEEKENVFVLMTMKNIDKYHVIPVLEKHQMMLI